MSEDTPAEIAPEGTWTTERTAQLVELWKAGVATAEMGRRLGVSKNAVLGKVHRMIGGEGELHPRVYTEKPKPREFNWHGCLWGIGDPKDVDFSFCGKTRSKTTVYCDDHQARVIQRKQPDADE